MSPADDVTSLSAIGGSAYPSSVPFTTTHWSVVPEAQEAFEKLCRVYWGPIYGFVRRQSGMEAAALFAAERICEHRWASTLLDRVLSRLDRYCKRGKAASFDSRRYPKRVALSNYSNSRMSPDRILRGTR